MRDTSGEHDRLKKVSMTRRLSGHILGLLIPTFAQEKQTPVERAVAEENAAIDHRQRAHFHANLFREIRPASQANIERLMVIKNQFEAELHDRSTIADRFSLFADPFYAPFINTLDLGETKKPGSHEEVAALKEEYHSLLKQLVDEHVIVGEFKRSQAKPTVHFSMRSESDYVSATRNRELFSFVDGDRRLSVAKRMTFLMPLTTLEEMGIAPTGGLNRAVVAKIEKLIDAQDPEAIIPVRTVYYARSKPLAKSDG